MKTCLGLILVVYMFWFGSRALYAEPVTVTLDTPSTDRTEVHYLAR